MKIGALLPTQSHSMPVQARVAGLMPLVEHLRESGWDGLFCLHHYLSNVETLQPLPTLARLVGESGEMDLGTCALILPLLSPVHVAEEAATLDQLSGGRFILGVGSGYREVEFQSMGVPMSERGARLREYITALRLLWSGEVVSYQGALIELRDVSIGCVPLQAGGPPIWVGAQTPRTIRRAFAIGDAWLAPGNSPRTGWLEAMAAEADNYLSEASSDAQTVRPIFLEVYVGENRADAEANVAHYLRQEYQAYGEYKALQWFNDHFESLLGTAFIIGDPSHVLDRLQSIASLGFNYLILRFQWGDMPDEIARKSVDLLTRHVFPPLRETSAESDSISSKLVEPHHAAAQRSLRDRGT